MVFNRLNQFFTDSSACRPRKPDLPDNLAEIYRQAQNGHVLEQVLWGKALLDSEYVPRDVDKAREWFTIAASASYGPAHNMLGRCSQFGWGCPLDLTEAVRHYSRAAQLDDLWGIYNLGICHMRGLGVQADRRTAFLLFRRAALRGHAKSMNLLARFIEEGWETPANPLAALEWYQRSADGGDYRGQHNYATALMGMGQPEDALRYWRMAVKDATPDILQAMQRELERPGAPQDPDLMETLRQRLKTALPGDD
ncbi:tetratricopeptide repeat protein [Bombella apis]|uniref:tetratricopeptide repeat protein n=1 Tax=Bombella apis TaxID=1785988 RepID=UPI0024A7A6E0|nr:tetratricopeptide repeat protein [Bombella apis]